MKTFIFPLLILLILTMSALAKVRVISLDVTGTIMTHRLPVYQAYSEAAQWAKLHNAPSPEELKPAFKVRRFCFLRPCGEIIFSIQDCLKLLPLN
jgi:hypothetical protein